MITFPEINRSDDNLCAAVARKLLPDVMGWFNSEESESDVLEDLTAALRREYDWDGFALAKELDDHFYDADARLVEILDAAGSYYHSERSAMIRRFVEQNGITPSLKVGDEVVIPAVWERTFSKEKLFGGVISHVYPDGKYSVAIPELGHKLPSESGSGTRGYCVTWDKVENNNATANV